VPLALPVIPVGLVLGLIVNETDQVSRLAGLASAVLVLGGASQLAAISILGTGAGVATTALTIAVINARHVMYSARLRSRFQHLPRWFRIVAPYVLLDQVFALAELAEAEQAPRADGERMAHYLGTGSVMAVVWWLAVAVGLAFGDLLPSGWSLEFTIPLLFLGLLVLSIGNLPGLAAAVVGGSVAVAASGLPNSTGLLVGAIAGIAVGGGADRFLARRSIAGHGPGQRASGGRP